MKASIITSLVALWIIGVIIAYLISVLFDSNYVDSTEEAIAKVILWPFTLVIYIIIGVILLVKHGFVCIIDILKGFWHFIKSVPEIIKDL